MRETFEEEVVNYREVREGVVILILREFGELNRRMKKLI